MTDPTNGLLTLIVFLPAAAAVAIALIGSNPRAVRWAAAGVMAAVLALSIYAWSVWQSSSAGVIGERLGQYDTGAWIPEVNALYNLSVDGLSLPMVVLTGLLGLAAVFGSWHVTTRVREYHVWLLLLITGVLGVFTARDLLLFFLFWEVELVPMYFLISVWGTGNKEHSAMKFVLYTLFGSAFMLVGVLVLRAATGTFDMEALALMGQGAEIAPRFLTLSSVFFLFLLAFAIKLPVWPLHTWLPDAHTDAPTAVSVLLAGVLLKMGGYGLIRINLGFFPETAERWAPVLVVFAVINVLYGAAVVFRQHDLKRLVAYSSVSHMGLVLLGVASLGVVGVTGAAMQMFAHGTITGLLFLVVGLMYDRAHTRWIPDLGGLAANMPILAAVTVVAGLASLGLPLLSGFAAEVVVFLGAFGPQPLATALAAFGIVLTAGYILWTIERVLFGPQRPRFAGIGDASVVDGVAMALLVAPIVVVGIYPAILMDIFEPAVRLIVGGN